MLALLLPNLLEVPHRHLGMASGFVGTPQQIGPAIRYPRANLHRLRCRKLFPPVVVVAESWSQKIREYEQEAEVIRTSVRRIDDITAATARQRETTEPEDVVKPRRRTPGRGSA